MKRNILIVDDNENNLFTLSFLLSRLNYCKVFESRNGQEALECVLLNCIDLILLDVQMPEMDGFEVASMLKSNTDTKNIPIIFLSAVFKSEEFVKKGYDVGAIDYLTKPIDNNRLLEKIEFYLNEVQKKTCQ